MWVVLTVPAAERVRTLLHSAERILSVFNRDLVVLHRTLGTEVLQLGLRCCDTVLSRHVCPCRVTDRVPRHLPVHRRDLRDVAQSFLPSCLILDC